MRKFNPSGIMPPFNNAYHHAVIIPANAEVLHIAGQVGAAPDGTTSPDPAEQSEQVWRNLVAILEAAEMTVANIVKLTAYVVSDDIYPAYAAVRNRYLQDVPLPASTAIYVPKLIMPEWLIEVEMIAAK
ncbi:MAG: RidA family protein [Pseudomonadota bacterium]